MEVKRGSKSIKKQKKRRDEGRNSKHWDATDGEQYLLPEVTEFVANKNVYQTDSEHRDSHPIARGRKMIKRKYRKPYLEDH